MTSSPTFVATNEVKNGSIDNKSGKDERIVLKLKEKQILDRKKQVYTTSIGDLSEDESFSISIGVMNSNQNHNFPIQ